MARILSAYARSTLSTVLLLGGVATLRAQATTPRPLVELAVWGGYTTFGDDAGPGTAGRNGEGGVRSIEAAIWPTPRLRLFTRFENTLTLDNLALIRADEAVRQYAGGALLDWGGRFTSVVHAGRRTLPGGVDQTLLAVEHVVYLPGGLALKAGALVGPREDNRTEWLTLAGASVPAGPRARLEPTVFYSRTGLAGESHWRALLAGEVVLSSTWRVGGGVAGGRSESFDAAYTGGEWDSFLRLSARLGGLNQIHFLVRHEEAAGANALTTVSAGIAVGVARP